MPVAIQAKFFSHVRKVPPAAIVAIDLVGGGRGEAHVQVDLTIGIEIAPGRSAGFNHVGQTHRCGDVFEPSMVLAIETVGTAAETDELVEISVVVEVGPGVRLTAGHAEQFRLNERERWCSRRAGERDEQQRGERQEPETNVGADPCVGPSVSNGRTHGSAPTQT